MTAAAAVRLASAAARQPSGSGHGHGSPALHLSFGHALLIDFVTLMILATVAFGVGAMLWWAFWPHHKVPRHRVRHLKLRAHHLRLHPGLGHATAFELWLRWGRLASWRESKRTRPSLSAWHRLWHPGEHSLFLGWAHYFLRIRITVQEHLAVIGPPRSWKSALLSWLIMAARGPVVSTSSKPDKFALTSGVRADRGPIWVFNPQGIGAIASNVMWSSLDGCAHPATARRRGRRRSRSGCRWRAPRTARSSPGRPPTRSPGCSPPRPRRAGTCGMWAHGRHGAGCRGGRHPGRRRTCGAGDALGECGS